MINLTGCRGLGRTTNNNSSQKQVIELILNEVNQVDTQINTINEKLNTLDLTGIDSIKNMSDLTSNISSVLDSLNLGYEGFDLIYNTVSLLDITKQPCSVLYEWVIYGFDNYVLKIGYERNKKLLESYLELLGV